MTVSQHTKTQQERYSQAFQLSQRLVTLISELPSPEFPTAMDQLKQYVSIMEKGNVMIIQEVSMDHAGSHDDTTGPSTSAQQETSVDAAPATGDGNTVVTVSPCSLHGQSVT